MDDRGSRSDYYDKYSNRDRSTSSSKNRNKPQSSQYHAQDDYQQRDSRGDQYVAKNNSYNKGSYQQDYQRRDNYKQDQYLNNTGPPQNGNYGGSSSYKYEEYFSSSQPLPTTDYSRQDQAGSSKRRLQQSPFEPRFAAQPPILIKSKSGPSSSKKIGNNGFAGSYSHSVFNLQTIHLQDQLGGMTYGPGANLPGNSRQGNPPMPAEIHEDQPSPTSIHPAYTSASRRDPPRHFEHGADGIQDMRWRDPRLKKEHSASNPYLLLPTTNPPPAPPAFNVPSLPSRATNRPLPLSSKQEQVDDGDEVLFIKMTKGTAAMDAAQDPPGVSLEEHHEAPLNQQLEDMEIESPEAPSSGDPSMPASDGSEDASEGDREHQGGRDEHLGELEDPNPDFGDGDIQKHPVAQDGGDYREYMEDQDNQGGRDEYLEEHYGQEGDQDHQGAGDHDEAYHHEQQVAVDGGEDNRRENRQTGRLPRSRKDANNTPRRHRRDSREGNGGRERRRGDDRDGRGRRDDDGDSGTIEEPEVFLLCRACHIDCPVDQRIMRVHCDERAEVGCSTCRSAYHRACVGLDGFQLVLSSCYHCKDYPTEPRGRCGASEDATSEEDESAPPAPRANASNTGQHVSAPSVERYVRHPYLLPAPKRPAPAARRPQSSDEDEPESLEAAREARRPDEFDDGARGDERPRGCSGNRDEDADNLEQQDADDRVERPDGSPLMQDDGEPFDDEEEYRRDEAPWSPDRRYNPDSDDDEIAVRIPGSPVPIEHRPTIANLFAVSLSIKSNRVERASAADLSAASWMHSAWFDRNKPVEVASLNFFLRDLDEQIKRNERITDAQIEERRERNRAQEEEKEEKEEQDRLMKEENEQIKQENEKLKKKMEEEEKRMGEEKEKMEKEKKRVEEEMKTKNEEKKEMEEKMKKMEDEKNGAEAEKYMLEEKIKKMEDEKGETEMTIKKLEEDKEKLKEEKENAEMKMKEMEEEKKKFEEDKEEMKEKMKEKDEETKKLEEEIKKMEVEKKDLKEEREKTKIVEANKILADKEVQTDDVEKSIPEQSLAGNAALPDGTVIQDHQDDSADISAVDHPTEPPSTIMPAPTKPSKERDAADSIAPIINVPSSSAISSTADAHMSITKTDNVEAPLQPQNVAGVVVGDHIEETVDSEEGRLREIGSQTECAEETKKKDKNASEETSEQAMPGASGAVFVSFDEFLLLKNEVMAMKEEKKKKDESVSVHHDAQGNAVDATISEAPLDDGAKDPASITDDADMPLLERQDDLVPNSTDLSDSTIPSDSEAHISATTRLSKKESVAQEALGASTTFSTPVIATTVASATAKDSNEAAASIPADPKVIDAMDTSDVFESKKGASEKKKKDDEMTITPSEEPSTPRAQVEKDEEGVPRKRGRPSGDSKRKAEKAGESSAAAPSKRASRSRGRKEEEEKDQPADDADAVMRTSSGKPPKKNKDGGKEESDQKDTVEMDSTPKSQDQKDEAKIEMKSGPSSKGQESAGESSDVFFTDRASRSRITKKTENEAKELPQQKKENGGKPSEAKRGSNEPSVPKRVSSSMVAKAGVHANKAAEPSSQAEKREDSAKEETTLSTRSTRTSSAPSRSAQVVQPSEAPSSSHATTKNRNHSESTLRNIETMKEIPPKDFLQEFQEFFGIVEAAIPGARAPASEAINDQKEEVGGSTSSPMQSPTRSSRRSTAAGAMTSTPATPANQGLANAIPSDAAPTPSSSGSRKRPPSNPKKEEQAKDDKKAEHPAEASEATSIKRRATVLSPAKRELAKEAGEASPNKRRATTLPDIPALATPSSSSTGRKPTTSSTKPSSKERALEKDANNSGNRDRKKPDEGAATGKRTRSDSTGTSRAKKPKTTLKAEDSEENEKADDAAAPSAAKRGRVASASRPGVPALSTTPKKTGTSSSARDASRSAPTVRAPSPRKGRTSAAASNVASASASGSNHTSSSNTSAKKETPKGRTKVSDRCVYTDEDHTTIFNDDDPEKIMRGKLRKA